MSSSSSSSGNVHYSVLSSAWDSLLERASTWDRRKVTVVVACFLVVVVVGLLSAQVHHLDSLDSRLRRFEEAVKEAVELHQQAEAAVNESAPRPEPWDLHMGLSGCRLRNIDADCLGDLQHLPTSPPGRPEHEEEEEDKGLHSPFDSCRKWCRGGKLVGYKGECVFNFRKRQCLWHFSKTCGAASSPSSRLLALSPACLEFPLCNLKGIRCLGRLVAVEKAGAPGDCALHCENHNAWLEINKGTTLGLGQCEWFAHNHKTGECRLLSTCPGVYTSGDWTSSEISCTYDFN